MTPAPGKRAWNAIVDVRIDISERKLQRQAKAAGGKWNVTKKVWELPYRTVIELGLHDLICSGGHDDEQ